MPKRKPWGKRRLLTCSMGSALTVLIVGLLLGQAALAQNWPSCGSSGCTAKDLKIDRVFIEATPCSGPTRSGVLKAELSASSTRYNVRLTAHVYVVGGGSPGYLKTIDHCIPGSFTGTQTVTLDSSVLWDCSASLELRYTLVSWQNQSDDFTCGSTLPCADITPKCSNEYYSQQIEIAGSESPNTAPTGSNSSVSTSEDTTYAFSVGDFGYSDADGDPLAQIRVTSLESVGSLELNSAPVALNQVVSATQISSGNLTYDSLPGQSGSPYDSFRFEVHDGTEYSPSDYQMTVSVTPVNDPPVAENDSAQTVRGEALTIPVLNNDSDPDGDDLTIVGVTPAADGGVGIVSDEIRYSPNLFFVGVDTFEYTVRDNQGLTASATVTVNIEDPNRPPTADANGIYTGLVGDAVLLDARFSHDPDVTDILQYRWDTNGDGAWDTDWLGEATYEVVYDRPHRGEVFVEVRDLYIGRPNGTSDQASAFALIEPRPTQLAVSVYVDLNGNGEFDEGDVGLPGVSMLVDGEIEVFTQADGTALVDDVAPGAHTVQISEEGMTFLQERGFFLSEEGPASVELQAGEWVALFFAPEARGFLEVDLGADEDDD